MSLILLFSLKIGFSTKHAGSCQPFCIERDCVTLNQDKVDFQTAENACWNSNGELAVFEPETDKSILTILSREMYGNVWIGLHLPAGTCSNLSTPLRGYQWTSGVHTSFTPSASPWKENIQVCSPHCVSLSSDLRWTERPCSEKNDGYLCRIKRRHARLAQELSDSNVFQSSTGCSSGPCQQKCTDVNGGYKCVCFPGYAPDSKDPRQCKPHCAEQKCPAVCNGNDDCSCPDGYIYSEHFCEDMDECSMNRCDQECINTYGGFVCSCTKGFVLVDQGKCIDATHVTTATNTTLKGSSYRAGGFLWLWIFCAGHIHFCNTVLCG